MSNLVVPNYERGGNRPLPQPYTKKCPLNQQIFYIPEDSNTHWERVALPPSTLKHQYSKTPFNYERVYGYRPKNTLYHSPEYIQTHPTGAGKTKVIGGGHYKVWPLTNSHIREVNDYTDYAFTKPLSDMDTMYWISTNPTHIRTDFVGY